MKQSWDLPGTPVIGHVCQTRLLDKTAGHDCRTRLLSYAAAGHSSAARAHRNTLSVSSMYLSVEPVLSQPAFRVRQYSKSGLRHMVLQHGCGTRASTCHLIR